MLHIYITFQHAAGSAQYHISAPALVAQARMHHNQVLS